MQDNEQNQWAGPREQGYFGHHASPAQAGRHILSDTSPEARSEAASPMSGPALNDENGSLTEVLDEACSFVSADMCLLLLYDGDGLLSRSLGIGVSAEQVSEFKRLVNTQPVLDYLNSLSMPVVANGVVDTNLALLKDWASTADVSSFALAPVTFGMMHKGIVAFYYQSARRFTDEDMRSLRMVSRMAGLLAVEVLERISAKGHHETKDRFINALSHELRTPLTSIIGFTQIIRKRLNNAAEKDERLLNQVDVLWSQAQRLNRLIDTFVDVSRLESGQFSIDPGKVEIVSTLKTATKQSIAQARSRHHVIFELPDHGIEVFADARRLDQVFSQVMSNAIRFSPESAPIVVRCEDDAAHNQVIVSVTDRGPGIPESRIREIFERFAASEPLRAGGLGVGLYISRSIVEAHGGMMSLESYPEKGTTIRIVLPK